MLGRQSHRVEFTGGLEAARLRDWHIGLLAQLSPQPVIWFAYDEAGDWLPLADATERLRKAGFDFQGHRIRCYVLVGYPGDTLTAATSRLECVVDLGLTPMAMLYRDDTGQTTSDWRRFQRRWARPAIIHSQATPF